MFDVQLCSNLLLEDVHGRLVGLQLLVLQQDLPSQLQWRRQVGVVAEVALEEEARHQTLPKHRLKGRDGWTRHQWTAADGACGVEEPAYQKSNNISSKQAPDDISRLEAENYLKMKGISLSDHREVKSPGRRGRWEAGLKMKAGRYSMMNLQCPDKCSIF